MGKNKSNTSSTSTTTPTFRNTNTTNPYFITKTDKNGNTTNEFVKGSAGETFYNYANDNAKTMLDNYFNPSLDSASNRAKLAMFNKQQQSNLQNNIINPLANNNMLRSSQATNMYNNLSNQAADYTNSLLADQYNTKEMIDTLINMYTTGYTGANNEINTAFKAAVGNSSTTNTNTKA